MDPAGMWRAEGPRRGLLAVLTLAFLVRAAYIAGFLRSPLFDVYRDDQIYYRAWGLWIADGHWLGSRVFEQGPLYAYLLGIFYRVFGPREPALLALQLCLGVMTVGLVHHCAARLFGARAALVSGALAAVYAPLVFYECMVMKTFLEPLLVLATLALAIDAVEGGRARWAAAGAAAGVLCLVREIHLLLLLPLLLAAAFTASAPGRWRSRASAAALVLAGFSVVLAPAVVRNRVVGGEWVLSTAGGGEVAYIAFGPSATGYYAVPDFVDPVPFREHQDFRNEAFLRTGRPLSRGASSRFWFREAVGAIVEAPGRAVSLAAAKLSQLFNDYEAPDSEMLSVTGELIPLLGWLPTFGWIAGLGWLGFGIALRRGRGAVLPVGFALVLILEVLQTYNFGRFRAGLAGVWLVLAGPAAVALADLARGADRRALGRAAAALAGVALLTLLAFGHPVGITQGGIERMRERYHAERIEAEAARRRVETLTAGGGAPSTGNLELLGASLNAIGKLPEAFTAYADFADAVPDPGQVLLLLADVSCTMGSLDAAESYSARYLALRSDDPPGLEMAARIEFQRAAEAGGRAEAGRHLLQAKVLLESALTIEPEMPAALTSLARVTYLLGEPAAASRLAARILELDPSNRGARGLLRILERRSHPGGW